MKIADGELRQILTYDLKLPAQTVRELVADGKQTGHSLLRTALSSKLVGEEAIARAQAKRLQVPFVDLAELTIPRKTLQRLPYPIAAKYHVVCFEETPTSLKVAMADPRSEAARRALKDYSGKTIRRYQATQAGLVAASRHYHKSGAPVHFSTRDLLTTLLEQALRNDSRDLHFELHDEELLIKRRAGKRLQIMSRLPSSKLRALISWCKLQSGNDVSDSQQAQHGRFSIRLAGSMHEVLVSIVPVVDGEKMVLRLVPSVNSLPSLKALGYRTAHVEFINQLLTDGRGLMVIAGDSRADVPTTLASLTKLASGRAHTSVTSIEEPIHYRIASSTQIEVTRALPFADAVDTVIGQNPNVVVTTQLGGAATAEQLVDFALSQHLVMSGLYAPTMTTALNRLMAYPLAPALMAASLRVIVVQHQLDKLCTKCRQSFTPSGPLKKALWEQFKFDKQTTLFRQGSGCESCHKGLNGSVPAIEWLPITRELQQLLATKADRAKLTDYVQGHSNLVRELGALARKGQISIDVATGRLAMDR